MYDWNKDGRIDVVDHWITHNIMNHEKEKRENREQYTSYTPRNYSIDNSDPSKGTEKKEPSLMIILLMDIALFTLIYLMKGL